MRVIYRTLSALAVLLGATNASSQSAVVHDANGAFVGAYIGVSYTGVATGEGWAILTPKGYAIVLDEVTGGFGAEAYVGHTNRGVSNVRFALANCAGEARVDVEVGGPQAPIVGGFVFRELGSTWYAPKGQVSAITPFASSIDDNGNCANGPGDTATILVLPNDPAVTGVPSMGYVGPLRLGFVPDTMFADSFEAVV